VTAPSPGPIAARVLLAISEHGEDALSDLSWARPLSEEQVLGAISQSVRQGWLVDVGEHPMRRDTRSKRRLFALTAAGVDVAAMIRAEAGERKVEAARKQAADTALWILRWCAEEHGEEDRTNRAMLAAREAGVSYKRIGAVIGLSHQGTKDLIERLTAALT
jgi:hypothetical protein